MPAAPICAIRAICDIRAIRAIRAICGYRPLRRPARLVAEGKWLVRLNLRLKAQLKRADLEPEVSLGTVSALACGCGPAVLWSYGPVSCLKTKAG